MQIKSFQSFITIAETPTLAVAAEKLFTSQPALSMQIKKIESELGVQLFNRNGRTMVLTPEGEAFLICARRITQSYEALKREIVVLGNKKQDSINMGISPFYSQHYLPRILPPFLMQHPDINVNIVEDVSKHLEKRLLAGELDFCVLPLFPKNDLLEYETIYDEEIFFAIPHDHPINEGYPDELAAEGKYPSIDLALMKNEPFIGLKAIQKFSAIGLRLCEEADFTPRTVCKTLNWETVHLMIASGLGVGFVPKILLGSIADPATAPRYYRLSSGVYRAYTIAQRIGTIQTSAARTLEDGIREFFATVTTPSVPSVRNKNSLPKRAERTNG